MKYPVSLIHGAWGSPKTLESLQTGLQNLLQTDVANLQLVGHGTEVFTPQMGGFGLREYEKSVLEQLGPQGILVGFSMGAICAFNLAQKHPERVQGVVMIDPPMLGGGADIRVTKALLLKPRRYILPLFTNGLFTPTYEDAKMMLFNGDESPHLNDIIRQPAAGRVIRQMLLGRLPNSSRRQCGLIIAEESRLHPADHKRRWARNVHAHVSSVLGSHCGILGDKQLPAIVHNLIKKVSI
jgi:pimeloyl-ACP methyl ester carboxylesterase